MYDILIEIVNIVESLGYAGLFIMTLAEGTFIPIPNELTLVPAGFLIAKGHFNVLPAFAVSIMGNLVGSLISYYIAQHFGRSALVKWGKYIGLNEEKMRKMENFFLRHGPISIFIGRIVPGVKHFISIPAGIANMNFRTFCMYSGAGGGIWVSILLMAGMALGKNEELLGSMVSNYTKKLSLYLLGFILILLAVYLYINAVKKKSDSSCL